MIITRGKNRMPKDGFDVVFINNTKGQMIRVACDPIEKKLQDAGWDTIKDEIVQMPYNKYYKEEPCKTNINTNTSKKRKSSKK